jgi:hypothetical protein
MSSFEHRARGCSRTNLGQEFHRQSCQDDPGSEVMNNLAEQFNYFRSNQSVGTSYDANDHEPITFLPAGNNIPRLRCAIINNSGSAVPQFRENQIQFTAVVALKSSYTWSMSH